MIELFCGLLLSVIDSKAALQYWVIFSTLVSVESSQSFSSRILSTIYLAIFSSNFPLSNLGPSSIMDVAKSMAARGVRTLCIMSVTIAAQTLSELNAARFRSLIKVDTASAKSSIFILSFSEKSL